MGSFVSIPQCRNHLRVSVNCSVSGGVNIIVIDKVEIKPPFEALGGYLLGEFPGDPDIAGIGLATNKYLPEPSTTGATSTFIESIKDAHAFFVGAIGHSVPDNKIEACNFYVLTLLFYGVAIIVETFKYIRRGKYSSHRKYKRKEVYCPHDDISSPQYIGSSTYEPLSAQLGELHKSNATAAEYHHHNSEEFSRGSGASARPGLDHQPSWASITARHGHLHRRALPSRMPVSKF
ncbi:hypothetical protein F5X96DRAFT_673855 [Biscogniauxia mediterranea]|nr:hypothetical protein F5X96DRAFT_673855 [Biscogniauxia mediterranea]